MMRSLRIALGMAAVSGALWACGKTATEAPPDPQTRLSPTMAEPSKQQVPAWQPSDGGAAVVYDAGLLCCQLNFAFRQQGELPAAVRIKGDLAPFSEGAGVSLAFDGGIWSGSACVPPGYDGYYYYELELPADDLDAGTFLHLTAVNENVPTVSGGPDSVANALQVPGIDSCSALDGGLNIHADASGPPEPDAGSTLPAKSVITGACDTLDAPTALLTSVNGAPDLDETRSALTALPFNVRFFGEDVTHFTASSNGFIQLFTSGSGMAEPETGEQDLPDVNPPNGVIAPLWTDLVQPAAGTTTLATQLFGSGNSRHLTVQWNNWRFFFGSGDARVTFQVKIFETTHAIELHYCQLDANGETSQFEQGFGASVGLENLSGTQGVKHSFHQAVLTTSDALRFEY